MEFSPTLWARVVKCAAARGYASPELYVTELVERELAKDEGSASDAEITQKMEELGYLDFGRDI
jgi:hypothetical protein